ncbi:MAG: SUMF1/EgtB/PvdO family nonheme iron enzyme [Desulfobacteraceae bacterium]|nr:SUMF1/EgtB/PvdO family nonheme iron enzyme [Desulfobacteraceae bacterium]
MSQPTVFISYSREDEKEKELLLSHLGVLEQDGLIDVWSDDRVAVGANWEEEIDLAVSQARVAILLITANYLSSGFILRKHVSELLQRREYEGITIFPVIAKACAWKKVKWLAKMNVRPKSRKPVWSEAGIHADEDLAAIAEEVAAILESTDDTFEVKPDRSPLKTEKKISLFKKIFNLLKKPKILLFMAMLFIAALAVFFGKDISKSAQILYFKLVADTDKELKQGKILKVPISDDMELEFVWISGGCYKMGCDEEKTKCFSCETPAHKVCVDGFWIGKYEVTQRQWKKIMKNNPSRFKNGDNYPVERISWSDAKNFIRRLNENKKTGSGFRLPTEAEWEYVCRSRGRPGILAEGEVVDEEEWYKLNNGVTHPVGSTDISPNSLKVYDMCGNVWEWCEDKYSAEAYLNYNPVNPETVEGSGRVVRGGGWYSSPEYASCSVRMGYAEDVRAHFLGFRLAKNP